ncbi:MAG: molecular chaperone HtpG [Erysipelotrichaceae bacterium]|nr:molecular chaperone HtpG [Erysipelotrichaceae bacterium]
MMKKKEFKAESKRVLDLMINSIYTNREIFLRELLSNASDAIDKLYFKSLTDEKLNIKREDLKITLSVDPKERSLTITDTGCGMNESDLENNLGVIAESGSLKFKEENKDQQDVQIIGQFGVGFYSAFMVSKKVEVLSKKYDSDVAYLWESEGVSGYTIKEYPKDTIGTTIKLYLKDDTEDENYSDYLTEFKIRSLVKKYSDYIRYPIMMDVVTKKENPETKKDEEVTETVTLNSMIPLWKKNKSDITLEEYNNFYEERFYDYEAPIKYIHTSVEGLVTYNALLYIPSHAPYDFYTKEYKKGLQLYTNGVLIMDKCEELLPDYYSFVKGVVDSDDLSLNISRETLQNDKNVKQIAKSLETKIHNELIDLLNNDFETYKKFFKAFGNQIKFGIYNMYGLNKDKLKDLLIFYSANKKDFITLDEYVNNMKEDQKFIYYASGETVDRIDLLPQVEQIKNKGFDILYLTDYVDEFAIQALINYNEKEFKNVSDASLDFSTEEEKKELEELNKNSKDVLEFLKDTLKDNVVDVRLTNKLSNHPVCLTTEGEISVEMQKVINAMPTDEHINASLVLEINSKHPIVEKLNILFNNDKEELKKYAKILLAEAKLIEGLPVENPTEISNLVVELISK